MSSKKPSIWGLLGPTIGIITLGMIAAFYLWLDSITTKVVVTDGYTNWLIMIISLTFSIIIAIVVNFRSKISQFDVHRTLENITEMIKSDYDLRIERKNNVADHLERTLQVLDNHIHIQLKQMEIWKKTTEEATKKEIEKTCKEK